jgi:hypothetical protein
VMRVGAQLIAHKEDLEDSKLTWIGIGFTASDLGFVLLIVTLIMSGLIARRSRGQSVAGATGLRVIGALSALLLVAYVVAIWAMTTKPG